jgi:hypothetical protein
MSSTPPIGFTGQHVSSPISIEKLAPEKNKALTLESWLRQVKSLSKSASPEAMASLAQLAGQLPDPQTSSSLEIQEVIQIIQKVAETKKYDPKLFVKSSTALFSLTGQQSPCIRRLFSDD